jgi:tetratricopeptide (TPR) repeat protein
VERARAGLEWYARADSFERGGIGWSLSPDDRVRVAYLHTALGEYAEAAEVLRSVVRDGNPTDALVFELLAVHAQSIRAEARGPDRADAVQRGNTEQLEIMREAIGRHPRLHGVRLRLSQQLFNMAQFEWSVWDVDDEAVTGDPKFWLNKGQIHALHGERDKMAEILDRVIAMDPQRPEILLEASQLANSIGRSADAQRLLDRTLEDADDAPTLMSAARIAAGAGRIEDARALVDRALDAKGGGRPGARFDAGRFYLSLGDAERGRRLMIDAADDLAFDRWQLLGVASALVRAGASASPPDETLQRAGLDRLRSLVDEYPDVPILRHDLAGWLFTAGDRDEAAEEIIRAAELGASNPVLAERAAQLLQAAGRTEEASAWQQRARERSGAP